MGNTHGQGIVSTGGSADAHAQSGAHTNKQCTHQGCHKGHVRQSGPQVRELFADLICTGESHRSQCGISDEFLANRRRTIQEAYNKEHGITPTTIKKAVRDLIAVSKAVAETEVRLQKDPESMTRKELTKLIAQVEKQMRAAAADLNFEQAAELRDKMIDLKKNLDILDK